MNKPSTRSAFSTASILLLAGLFFIEPKILAATAYWTAGGGADTNWSTGGNWIGGSGAAGALANGDQVVFTNAGLSASSTAISNVVNTGFNISSLRYSITNTGAFHTTLILPGVTLSITNNNGPAS